MMTLRVQVDDWFRSLSESQESHSSRVYVNSLVLLFFLRLKQTNSHEMFKKRQTSQISRRKRTEDPSHNKIEDVGGVPSDEDEPSEEKKRIQSAKDRHQLRHRLKGLSATFDSEVSVRKEEASSEFDLLDKTFRQQRERTETTKHDKDLYVSHSTSIGS